MDNSSRGPSSKAGLSLWDTVSVIIGIVVGAGIYETPPEVLKIVGSSWVALLLWGLGGVLSIIGALTYAELASTYPRSGGDYVYLSRAFGRGVGFLFGWAQLAVIMTGSIGMMAYIFAGYSLRLWNPSSPGWAAVLASLAVIVLSAINIVGMSQTILAQNLLTGAKVLGLIGILVAGFLLPMTTGQAVEQDAVAQAAADAAVPGDGEAGSTTVSLAALGIALVFVLLTYGGWNDAAFFVAEMRDSRKIILALILGTAGIMALYVLVNAAYLSALGFEAASKSNAIAADVLQKPFGNFGARVISVLVMISALGALNGLIFAGSRLYATIGADHPIFALLSRRHPRLQTPVWSIGIQALISLAMIAAVGSPVGQRLLNSIFEALGLDAVSWAGLDGFVTLLRCTAPVFWFFFLLTSISLFVLRIKDPKIVRPFRVPLYPFLPLVFTAVCAYMVYSGMLYAGSLVIFGLALLAPGFALYLVSERYMSPKNKNVL